jgi:hypothetical protein
MRRMISTTAARWRGSVVRMKSSYEMARSAQADWKAAAMPSTHSCGVTPAADAVCATFWPCSSIPITKCTGSPLSRW